MSGRHALGRQLSGSNLAAKCDIKALARSEVIGRRSNSWLRRLPSPLIPWPSPGGRAAGSHTGPAAHRVSSVSAAPRRRRRRQRVDVTLSPPAPQLSQRNLPRRQPRGQTCRPVSTPVEPWDGGHWMHRPCGRKGQSGGSHGGAEVGGRATPAPRPVPCLRRRATCVAGMGGSYGGPAHPLAAAASSQDGRGGRRLCGARQRWQHHVIGVGRCAAVEEGDPPRSPPASLLWAGKRAHAEEVGPPPLAPPPTGARHPRNGAGAAGVPVPGTAVAAPPASPRRIVQAPAAIHRLFDHFRRFDTPPPCYRTAPRTSGRRLITCDPTPPRELLWARMDNLILFLFCLSINRLINYILIVSFLHVIAFLSSWTTLGSVPLRIPRTTEQLPALIHARHREERARQ